MSARILTSAVLAMLLAGCGQDAPEPQSEKTFGGRLGDSYKGMLDEARQGADHANEHLRDTEQAVRERDQ